MGTAAKELGRRGYKLSRVPKGNARAHRPAIGNLDLLGLNPTKSDRFRYNFLKKILIPFHDPHHHFRSNLFNQVSFSPNPHSALHDLGRWPLDFGPKSQSQVQRNQRPSCRIVLGRSGRSSTTGIELLHQRKRTTMPVTPATYQLRQFSPNQK